MIHRHKLKIKSLRENLKEVEIELFEVIGELQRGKDYVSLEEWSKLKRLNEQLLRTKKKIKGSISGHKKKIRLIKQRKPKKKKK